jgi:hypothetical protein
MQKSQEAPAMQSQTSALPGNALPPRQRETSRKPPGTNEAPNAAELVPEAHEDIETAVSMKQKGIEPRPTRAVSMTRGNGLEEGNDKAGGPKMLAEKLDSEYPNNNKETNFTGTQSEENHEGADPLAKLSSIDFCVDSARGLAGAASTQQRNQTVPAGETELQHSIREHPRTTRPLLENF